MHTLCNELALLPIEAWARFHLENDEVHDFSKSAADFGDVIESRFVELLSHGDFRYSAILFPEMKDQLPTKQHPGVFFHSFNELPKNQCALEFNMDNNVEAGVGGNTACLEIGLLLGLAFFRTPSSVSQLFFRDPTYRAHE